MWGRRRAASTTCSCFGLLVLAIVLAPSHRASQDPGNQQPSTTLPSQSQGQAEDQHPSVTLPSQDQGKAQNQQPSATPPSQSHADGSPAQPSCATADALAEAGETAAARKSYVAVLEADPSLGCARKGLAKVNAPPAEPAAADCARGRVYLRVERNEDAIKAFEAGLKDDPSAECAEAGLRKASHTSFVDELEDAAKDVVSFLSSMAVFAGVGLLVLFLLLLFGYIPGFRVLLRRLPLTGHLLGPRLTIQAPVDDAVDGKAGAPIAARIKERLQQMRELAAVEDDAAYDLDRSTLREEFADIVSESSGLKNALEKASDVSAQAKAIAAILNLVYAALPTLRISISGVLEPPGRAGPAATFLLERNTSLVAATTLSGPKPPTGKPAATDYAQLADPAAVWAQYEVAQLLADRLPRPGAAEAYALVREGLEFQLTENWAKARQRYVAAIKLDRRNWAAYVNLAVADARLAEDFDSAVATLEEGFEALLEELE